MAAGETDRALDVRWREHLACHDALDDVRCEAGDLGKNLIGHSLTAVIPGTGGECVRRVFGEHAHDVLAIGSDGRVIGGVEVELGPARRGLAGTAPLVGSLGLVEASRDGDHRSMWRVVRSCGGECGQPREGAVDLQHGTLHTPLPHLLCERGGRLVRKQTEGCTRVGVGDDRPGVDAGTVLERHRFTRNDLADPGVSHNDGAGFLGCPCQRERDVAHAALDVAPRTPAALDRPHRVHRVDRRGAGVARTGPGADQALAVQRGAQSLVTHVTFDDRCDRLLEHDLDQLRIVAEQLLEGRPVGGVSDPRVVRLRTQSASNATEKLLVSRVTVGVSRAHRRDDLVVARGVVPQGQGRPVVERTPQVRIDDVHAIPVTAQVELVDHTMVEEAHEVRARAHHESRILEGMLERARATDAITRLEHEHRASGAREVGGGGETVVTGSDDDGIPRRVGAQRPRPDVGVRHGATRRARSFPRPHRLP